MSDSDWKWLLAHTEYSEGELNDMLVGISNSQCHMTHALCRVPGRIPRRRHLSPSV